MLKQLFTWKDGKAIKDLLTTMKTLMVSAHSRGLAVYFWIKAGMVNSTHRSTPYHVDPTCYRIQSSSVTGHKHQKTPNYVLYIYTQRASENIVPIQIGSSTSILFESGTIFSHTSYIRGKKSLNCLDKKRKYLPHPSRHF